MIAAFGGDLLPDARGRDRARPAVAMHRSTRCSTSCVTTGSRLSARPEPVPVGEGHVRRRIRWCGPAALIVCAAECVDGFPDHGSYREVLTSAGSPERAAGHDRGPAADGARPVAGADPGADPVEQHRVVMHTASLSDAELAAAHLEQTADIAATVAAGACARSGRARRVCVLPEGPQTIPFVADGAPEHDSGTGPGGLDHRRPVGSGQLRSSLVFAVSGACGCRELCHRP